MRITAYLRPGTTDAVQTGVAKHTIQVIRGLAAAEDVRLQLFTSRKALDENGVLEDGSVLRDLPTVGYPGSRGLMERLWTVANMPMVDRWTGPTDWLYCSLEAYVATKKAALAVTVHDTHAFEPDLPWSNTSDHIRFRRRWEMRFRPIRKHARLIIAVSEFIKSRLVELLDIDPRRIVVIGNGVEEEFFADPPPIGSDGAMEALLPQPYLCVVGPPSPKKGLPYLLGVARELSRRRPEMKIYVSAFTPPGDAVKLPDNIVHLGYVPLGRQVWLLRNATALLMLSRFEGFGIPPLEAMAVGTPAIVSAFAALPEVVGEAGLIVDIERSDTIVDLIERLEADRPFRDAVVARGRARVSNFHWSSVVSRVLLALRERL